MVRGGADQTKFVYLDMPDFGLDVLLVQLCSFVLVFCFCLFVLFFCFDVLLVQLCSFVLFLFLFVCLVKTEASSFRNSSARRIWRVCTNDMSSAIKSVSCHGKKPSTDGGSTMVLKVDGWDETDI